MHLHMAVSVKYTCCYIFICGAVYLGLMLDLTGIWHPLGRYPEFLMERYMLSRDGNHSLHL